MMSSIPKLFGYSPHFLYSIYDVYTIAINTIEADKLVTHLHIQISSEPAHVLCELVFGGIMEPTVVSIRVLVLLSLVVVYISFIYLSNPNYASRKPPVISHCMPYPKTDPVWSTTS